MTKANFHSVKLSWKKFFLKNTTIFYEKLFIDGNSYVFIYRASFIVFATKKMPDP